METSNNRFAKCNKGFEADSTPYFDGEDCSNITLDLETCQDEFKQSFVDLYNHECDKYLVPLFSDKICSDLRGNGVIIGPLLITAAHVAQTEPDKYDRRINLQELYFYYDDILNSIGDNQLVYDGRGYRLNAKNLDDIIIYKLETIKSNFVLNTAQLEENIELSARLYAQYDGVKVKPHNCLCKIVSLEYRYTDHIIWNNCFKIYNEDHIFNGNSGGAVLRNNIVYGIITRAFNSIGTVIDARYIKGIIDNKTQI